MLKRTKKLREKRYKNKDDRAANVRLASCVDDGEGRLIILNCPYCGRDHIHGALPGDTRLDCGRRAAHCGGAEGAADYRLWCVIRVETASQDLRPKKKPTSRT